MADDGYQPRVGREGARWYNQRPSAVEVADWFATVKLHDGLQHDRYVAGISLIQTSEVLPTIVGYHGDGTPQVSRVDEIVYTPYPRVEARIAYFWDYVATIPRASGVIEAGPIPDRGAAAMGLPEGFFYLGVPLANGETVGLIGRTMRARILGPRGEDLHVYPSEAKTVPMVYGGMADPHAIAKASTGAIGRALGVAGMLVLPGTGVATAEDMTEVQTARAAGRVPEGLTAALEAARTPDPEAQRARLEKLLEGLLASDKRETLTEWWNDRHFPGHEALDDEQLQAALAKAEVLAERAIPVEASA